MLYPALTLKEIFFFLGLLLSISSLETAGILWELAIYLDAHIPNVELIAGSIGVVSAVIDNVPLVAATKGMHDLFDAGMTSSDPLISQVCKCVRVMNRKRFSEVMRLKSMHWLWFYCFWELKAMLKL